MTDAERPQGPTALRGDERATAQPGVSNNTERLLSIAEVAALTGMSASSVRRWCESAELKAYHLGSWRIHVDDLEAFLRGRCNQTDQGRKPHLRIVAGSGQ